MLPLLRVRLFKSYHHSTKLEDPKTRAESEINIIIHLPMHVCLVDLSAMLSYIHDDSRHPNQYLPNSNRHSPLIPNRRGVPASDGLEFYWTSQCRVPRKIRMRE